MHSKYYYNPETCRYEQARLTLGHFLSYSISIVIVSSLLFAGILYLHSKLFTTPEARALQNENKALQAHFTILTKELNQVQVTLSDLRHLDESVHEKLFEEPLQQELHHSKNYQTLLADAGGFKSFISLLRLKSANLMSQSSAKNLQYLSFLHEEKPDAPELLPTLLPVDKKYVNKLASGFGVRINPYHKRNYHHSGADFAVPKGTPVLATGSGRVVDIGQSNLEAGFGNYIEIDHGNGIITRYAHLEQILVRTGQEVFKASVIGLAGMSGGATAPHVHYEIIRNGKPVNPVMYMLECLSSDEHNKILMLGRKQNQSLD